MSDSASDPLTRSLLLGSGQKWQIWWIGRPVSYDCFNVAKKTDEVDSGTHLGSLISCCSPSGSSGRHSRLTRCVTGSSGTPSNECESRLDLDLLPRSSFGTQEMQWFHFKTLQLFGVSCFDSFTVIPSSPRQSGAATRRPSAAAITNSAFFLFPFFCRASKSPDVQARAFNLSVSARRCLLRVLPFNVITFSCLWALITLYFFDNTSAASPSQNLLRHSALKSKHAESLQRRSHFNWLISIKEAFFFTSHRNCTKAEVVDVIHRPK